MRIRAPAIPALCARTWAPRQSPRVRVPEVPPRWGRAAVGAAGDPAKKRQQSSALTMRYLMVMDTQLTPKG